MSPSWTPVVGDLVMTRSEKILVEVLQIHSATRQVCLRPYHERSALGIWRKLDEIEPAPGWNLTGDLLEGGAK